MIRHLITSEYPPQPGGVSDYTRLLASSLANAGDEVHVWCPPAAASRAENVLDSPTEDSAEVFVHSESGRFKLTDLLHLGRMLNQYSAPRALLVQWVPHGYGYRSMNLPFCLWVWLRATFRHDHIEIMVHEPFLAFGEGSRKQDVAAAVHRLMVFVLLKAARFVWVAIPDWEQQLRPLLLKSNKSFGWLPVPSNIPVVVDPDGVTVVRAQYASFGDPLVGHFGAYDPHLAQLMLQLLPLLLEQHDKLSVMLLGKGSRELLDDLLKRYPGARTRIHATGSLSAVDLSRHISACDFMLQPYQDGVSGRRTSVMTALSHGIPVLTTIGKATESCWRESRAVLLSPTGDIRAMSDAANTLLMDAAEHRRLSIAGRALYEEKFDVARTVAALRHGHTQAELKQALVNS